MDDEPMEPDVRDEVDDAARTEAAWRILGLAPELRESFNSFVTSQRASSSRASSLISQSRVNARRLTGEPSASKHSSPSTSTRKPTALESIKTAHVFKTPSPAPSKFASRNVSRLNSPSRMDPSSKSTPVAPLVSPLDTDVSIPSRPKSPPGATNESPQSPPPKRSRVASPQFSRVASPTRQSPTYSLTLSQIDPRVWKVSVEEYYLRYGFPEFERQPPEIIEMERSRAQSYIESCHQNWNVAYNIDSRIDRSDDDSDDRWVYYGMEECCEKYTSNNNVPTQTNADVPPMPVDPETAERYVPEVPDDFVEVDDVMESMRRLDKMEEPSSFLAQDEKNRNHKDWRTGKAVSTDEEEEEEEEEEEVMRERKKLSRHYLIFSYRWYCRLRGGVITKRAKKKIEAKKKKGLKKHKTDLLVPVGYEFVPADENAKYDGAADDKFWKCFINSGKVEEEEVLPTWKRYRKRNRLYDQYLAQNKDEDNMADLLETADEEVTMFKQEDQDDYEKTHISEVIFNRHTFREPREDSPSPPLKKDRKFCNKIDCKLYYDIPLNEYEQEVHDEWRKIIPTGEFGFPYPPKEYFECCHYGTESYFYTLFGGNPAPVMFPYKVHPAMRIYLFEWNTNEYQREMAAKNPPIELTSEQQVEYDALPEFDPFTYYEHRPGEEEEWVVRPRPPSRMPKKSERQWKPIRPKREPRMERMESEETSAVGTEDDFWPEELRSPGSLTSAQVCEPPAAEPSDVPVSVPLWQPLTVQIGDWPKLKSLPVQPVLLIMQPNMGDRSGTAPEGGIKSSSEDRLRRRTPSPIHQQAGQERSSVSVEQWQPMNIQTSNSPVMKSPAEMRQVTQPADLSPADNVIGDGDQPTAQPIAPESTERSDSPMAVEHWKPMNIQTVDTSLLKSPSVSNPSAVVVVETSTSTTQREPFGEITETSDSPMSVHRREPTPVQAADSPILESSSVVTQNLFPLTHMEIIRSFENQAIAARVSETEELYEKREKLLGAESANELLAQERLELNEFLEKKGLPGVSEDNHFEMVPEERMDVEVELRAEDTLQRAEQTQDKNIPSTSVSTVDRALSPTVQVLETPTDYDPLVQEYEEVINNRHLQQSVSTAVDSEERLLLFDSPTFDEPPHPVPNVFERSPTPDLLREPSEEPTGGIGTIFDSNALLDETSNSPMPSNQLLEDALLEDDLLDEPIRPAQSLSPDNLLYDEMYGIVDDAPMPTAEQERELLDGLDEPEVAPVPVVPVNVETVVKKPRRSRKSVPKKIVEPASELQDDLAPGPAPAAQKPEEHPTEAVTEDVPVVPRTRSRSVGRSAPEPAPGPAPTPVMQEAEVVPEEVPRVPRSRNRHTSKQIRQSAPGPAPKPASALQDPESQVSEDVPEKKPVVSRSRSKRASKPATQSTPGPAPTPVVQESEAVPEEEPVVSRTRSRPTSKPTVQSAPEPAPILQDPEPQVPEEVPVVSRTRSTSTARPAPVAVQVPQLQVEEVTTAQSAPIPAPTPAPTPVTKDSGRQRETVAEDVPVVSRTRSRPTSKPQSAPGPAPTPIVQEPQPQVADAVPEEEPVVSRTRSRPTSKPTIHSAPGPAPIVQDPEPQVPEEVPVVSRARSRSTARPTPVPVQVPELQVDDVTTAQSAPGPSPSPAPIVQDSEPQADAVTEEDPVLAMTGSRPVSREATPSASGPSPDPVAQEPEPQVTEEEATSKRTTVRCPARPSTKPAGRRAVSRKAAPETEPEMESEEREKEPEEQQETPKRKKRNEDSPPPEPIRATRAKRLFLSKNNPTPRARAQADPNAPSTSTAPPPTVQDTPTQAAQLPAAIRDMLDDEPENQPGPSTAYIPTDAINIKPEPVSDGWEIPPPITETSRNSKKRKRHEQLKVLDDMKQECRPDPDCEVTQAYTVGYKKIKEDPDADEDLIVEKMTFNLKTTLVPLEPECEPAKVLRADGKTKPNQRYLATKRLWEEVNQVFLTDPYQFSKLAIYLTNKKTVMSRVFHYSVPVESRTNDFTQELIDFLATCPKKMTKEQEKYIDYPYFHAQFYKTCNRFLDERVTATSLHRVIGDILQIKLLLEKQADKLIKDAERDNLRTVETILCDQYITSATRMADLSLVKWATVGHLNRRLEMLQNGWRMFLRAGGFFRVLLALDREDVQKMSDEFRCYCTEYLENMKAKYQEAIEVYRLDEDFVFNEIIDNAGLTQNDLKELDADIRVEELDSHPYSCTDCRKLNDMNVRFSTSELLYKHSLIHTYGGITEDGEGYCGICFEEQPLKLELFHRINWHVNMRIEEPDYTPPEQL